MKIARVKTKKAVEGESPKKTHKKEKRKYFDAGATQKISIILKNLPKAEILRQSLLHIDETIKMEHIEALLSAWPE